MLPKSTSRSSSVYSTTAIVKRNTTDKFLHTLRKAVNKISLHNLSEKIDRQDWGAVVAMCENCPNKAQLSCKRAGFYNGQFDSKLLPIHQICAADPPETVLEAVISAFEGGVSMEESTFGRLPIHVACRSCPSPHVVTTLLHYFQYGAVSKDVYGRIPLHYACFSGAPREVVDNLLWAYPDGPKEVDNKKWLPIHVACSSGAPLDVVAQLIKSYPESLFVKTGKGRTPLRCAQQANYAHRDSVVALLEKSEKYAMDAGIREPPERRATTLKSPSKLQIQPEKKRWKSIGSKSIQIFTGSKLSSSSYLC